MRYTDLGATYDVKHGHGRRVGLQDMRLGAENGLFRKENGL